jgi:hypothetical protein
MFNKEISATVLSYLSWEKVFRWLGLPQGTIGDRDTWLTAHHFRVLTASLQVCRRLSVAYYPRRDGATEKSHSTLLGCLRATSNAYHSNWGATIPRALYAYHNTFHTATGYNPPHLLFGWHPPGSLCSFHLASSI